MNNHTDSSADCTSHSKKDKVSEFTSYNPSATDDLTISIPEGGRRQIEFYRPLVVAMARENKPDYESLSPRDIALKFDEAICDITEKILEIVDLDNCGVELHKLRALLLKEARGLNYGELEDYISTYSISLVKQFGLKLKYEQSTYRKAAKKLKNTEKHGQLVDAAFIAANALFWHGVPIPNVVQLRYDLKYSKGPKASEFLPKNEQLGLYALVDKLLDIIAEHLTFKRGENAHKSLDTRTVVGAFAHAASNNISIEDYEQVAQHLFDLDSVLCGSSIPEEIDKLSVWEIEDMFATINQELFRYILDAGVAKPFLVSYDLTDIETLGMTDINEPYSTKDGRLVVASLSITDPDLEFTFQQTLLKSRSKSQRAGVLKRCLDTLTSMANVRLLMADRGFDSGEDIEACRKHVPENYLIAAQDYSETRGIDDHYSKLLAKLEPGNTAHLKSAGYEDLKPPVQMIGYSGTTEDDTDVNPVRAFFTGIELADNEEDRETQITNLNFVYNQRAKIEDVFRGAKNEMDIATDTDKPGRKIFYFNISVLLYNIYKISNAVPEPIGGLELDTTQKEILTVIQNLAFGGPRRPESLDFLRSEL